jgi:hypothetical protein
VHCFEPFERECKSVSFTLFHPSSPLSFLGTDIDDVGVTQIVHGWLVKDFPELCARSCFVDSVCFCLWECVFPLLSSLLLHVTDDLRSPIFLSPPRPWVCHNFLVRRPRKPIEFLMRYFVSRELGVAFMLSRTFSWTSNLLFPSQIPNVSNPQKSAVFLSSEDSILNAERMRSYLRRNGLKEVKGSERVGEREGGGGLKVFEGLKHGESMIGEGLPFEVRFPSAPSFLPLLPSTPSFSCKATDNLCSSSPSSPSVVLPNINDDHEQEVLAWVKWDERDPTAYSSGGGSDTSAPPTAGEESS